MAYILKQKTVHGRIHLYWTESVYRKGKKPGQIRKYIGILDSSNHELLKNRKLETIPAEIVSALKKNGIEYNGNSAPLPGRIPCKRRVPASLCKTYEVGRVAVLQNLADQSGLIQALEEAFGAETSKEILALSIYQCCEGTAMYLAESWVDDTILAEQSLPLSGATISRLCTEFGKSDAAKNLFFRAWIKLNKYPKALVHDTTSFSSYAEKINQVEWGYNRDKEALPQVNFGLVYARETQLPLFYRLIPGSITDVVTLTTTSALLKELGLLHFSFSLDRGYFSKANLWDLIKNKLDFNIGFPLKCGGQKILDEHRHELTLAKNLIVENNIAVHHTETDYELSALGKGRPHTLQAHIYCDIQKKAELTQSLNILLSEIIKSFKSKNFKSKYDAEEWCEQHVQGKMELFKLNGHRNGNVTLDISEKAFAEATKDLGIFLLLTSQKCDGMEALRVNKKRDAAEKIFDTLKNSVGDGRLHGYTEANIEGRLFVAFTATILHTLFENRLRDNGLSTTKYTVSSALAMLKKIKVTIGSDGTRIPNEIPKKGQDLLTDIKMEIKAI